MSEINSDFKKLKNESLSEAGINSPVNSHAVSEEKQPEADECKKEIVNRPEENPSDEILFENYNKRQGAPKSNEKNGKGGI